MHAISPFQGFLQPRRAGNLREQGIPPIRSSIPPSLALYRALVSRVVWRPLGPVGFDPVSRRLGAGRRREELPSVSVLVEAAGFGARCGLGFCLEPVGQVPFKIFLFLALLACCKCAIRRKTAKLSDPVHARF